MTAKYAFVQKTKNDILASIPAGTSKRLSAWSFNTDYGDGNERMVTDYSGFVYDSDDRCMLMFGGGHSATWVDSVFRFDLGPNAALDWAKDQARTPWSTQQDAENLDVYGTWKNTGHPYARHTWDMLAYCPNIGELVLMTGSPSKVNAADYDPYDIATSGRIHHYDPGVKTWNVPFTTSDRWPWAYHAACEYDPISGKVIIVGQGPNSGAGKVWSYDPLTGVRGTGIDDPSGWYSQNLVYAAHLDAFYYINSATGEVYRIDPGRSDSSNPLPGLSMTLLETTGTLPLMGESGFAYNSRDRIIGGGVSSGYMYIFNPDTLVWSRILMTKDPAGVTMENVAFHCLAYDPANGIFLYLTTYSGTGAYTWAFRYA